MNLVRPTTHGPCPEGVPASVYNEVHIPLMSLCYRARRLEVFGDRD
jgi:hypothetical protein